MGGSGKRCGRLCDCVLCHGCVLCVKAWKIFHGERYDMSDTSLISLIPR